MTQTMFDAVTLANVPADAAIVACYVDGLYANEAEARRRFPHAMIVTITVFGAAGAEWCDCETGDLTPAQAVAWSRSERAAGRLGGIYANASTHPTVAGLLSAAELAVTPRWVANYDGNPTVPAGFVAKQYQSTDVDVSSVIDSFPYLTATTPAAPTPAASTQEATLLCPSPTGGTLVVRPNGDAYAFDGAEFCGGFNTLKPPVTPAAPIVGCAYTRTGKGYWMVGADGGVFAFGDAPAIKGLNQRPDLHVGAGQPNSPIIGCSVAPEKPPAGMTPWSLTVVADPPGSPEPELYRL